MNDTDRKQLLSEYPEAPVWILERQWSLDQARATMKLRRDAFPKTIWRSATTGGIEGGE